MRNDGMEKLAHMFIDRNNKEEKIIEIAKIINTNPLTIRRENGFEYKNDRLIVPQSLIEKEYKCEITKNSDKSGENIGTIEYLLTSETIVNLNTREDMLILKLKYEINIDDEVIIIPVGNSYLLLDKIYRGGD